MLYPRREPPDSDASEIPDPETPVYGGLSDPDEMQIQAPGTFQSVKPHEIVALLNFVEESIGKQVRPGRASVAKQLRDWVDEWINSGRDAHGVETPATRNYEKAQTVERAVEDYSLGSRMCLMGFGQALYLSFDLFGQTEESVAGKFTLAPAIKTIAGEKLVLILLSDLRFKLARCRHQECGKFFILKHWKRTYRNGTFCSECQRQRSHNSALLATANGRERVEEELHLLVAKQFKNQILADPGWHKDPKLKARITRYLNSRIERSAELAKAYPRGITGKWIARESNWDGITQTAKEGAPANVSVSL